RTGFRRVQPSVAHIRYRAGFPSGAGGRRGREPPRTTRARLRHADGPEAKPLADQKKATRSVLRRKVGRIARLRDVPHSHIHGKLNDICGDTSPTATAETLEKRLDLLDRWLSES